MAEPTHGELRLELASALAAYDESHTEHRAEVTRLFNEMSQLRAALVRVTELQRETVAQGRETIIGLQGELARVKEERDAAKHLEPYCDRLAAELARHEEAEQERPRALLIQDLAVSELALETARAETARLRERVQSVADKLCALAVEYRRNPQVHSTYSECASRIHAALTSDPEPTT